MNPLGPSSRAVEAILANIDAIARYPDPEAKLLVKAVSDRTGLPQEMIVAGNGAIEIIYLLVKLLKPRRALIPAPTFNEYEIAVRINGGEVKDLLLQEGKGFALDKEDVFRHWEDSDLIFVCNPNNPTGCLVPREELREIIREAGKLGKIVVVDEAFMDFVPDRFRYSVADLVPDHDNLFVVYSLTKFFAVPGLRLGVGLGNPGIVGRLNRIRDPWNVNCFAQLAGAASLADETYIKATVEYVSREKDYLFGKIRAIEGFRPYKPNVNYIFIDVEGAGYSSPEMCRILGQRGILVRDCSSYKNLRPAYIRVAVRKREENEKLIEALLQMGGVRNGKSDQALFGKARRN